MIFQNKSGQRLLSQASRRLAMLVATLLAPMNAQLVQANGVGENGSWQFQTSQEAANRAYVEDMRLKRQSGYYAAPNYTTNIGHQYNCGVNSTATGNQSASTAIGNSPTTTGSTASSAANTNAGNLQPAANAAGSSLASTQNNTGQVGATVNGGTSASVVGDATQALNTDQNNSGAQTATVNGSTACQFGMLN